MPQPAANDGVTAGTLLRRAREATGLHVAALAVSLKVPVRKLEALEEDRWDLLTDAVFVRALASSVCRTLKIDPQPVLERLPQPTAPRLLKVEDGIGTPYRAPSDGSPPSWLDHVTKPVFLAVFALLLGALVLDPASVHADRGQGRCDQLRHRERGRTGGDPRTHGVASRGDHAHPGSGHAGRPVSRDHDHPARERSRRSGGRPRRGGRAGRVLPQPLPAASSCFAPKARPGSR